MASTLGCAASSRMRVEGFVRRLRRIVRMDADGGVDERIAIGQADGGFEIGRTVAGADGHHALDAGRARALDDGVAVGVELWIVQMDSANRSASLQARPDGDVFEEAGEHGLAAFDATRRRSCRSIRCPSACAAADWRRSRLCG